jgi:hypothetical protein
MDTGVLNGTLQLARNGGVLSSTWSGTLASKAVAGSWSDGYVSCRSRSTGRKKPASGHQDRDRDTGRDGSRETAATVAARSKHMPTRIWTATKTQ